MTAAVLDLVDPVAAEWVRVNVLRGAQLIPCSCRWGRCGHCQAGNHSSCTTKAHPVIDDPETWILNRAGGVIDAGRGAVWLADRTCRWICPCDCPAPEPPAVQTLDLGEIPTAKSRRGQQRPARATGVSHPKFQPDLFGVVT